MAKLFPPPPVPGGRAHQWRDLVEPWVADALCELSDIVKNAMEKAAAECQADPDEYGEPEDVGCDDDFYALWIGLLLASGRCESYHMAANWASFARYSTDDLVS